MDKKIDLIVLFGESGCGKTSIRDKVLELRPDLNKIVSATTRPMRAGEEEGVTYHYYTEQQMIDAIYSGEMLEAVPFRDWVYGTPYSSLEKNKLNLGIFNPAGVEIVNDDSRINCINFYIYCPTKTRLIRSLSREENPDIDEIFRRYGTDKADFHELAISNYYYINSDENHSIEDAANQIVTILKQLNI